MHRLGGRKIFLFGFIAVLLIGIPVTIYLVQRQQETRSRAEKSTNLTFTPDSSPSAPIQKKIGESIPLDIFVDPGTNLVSFVKLEIQYDPEKIATASADAFKPDVTTFPSVLEGPVYTPGKISVTLSVGPDPTKAIQTKAKAATVTFKAVSNTAPGTPTLVSYGASTQALSIGFNDQASENVLSSATPAHIIIGGDAGPSEPIPTGTPAPTIPAIISPTAPAVLPPVSLPPVSLPPAGGATPSANTSPVCTTLTVDKSPSGAAPLSLNFGATGSDPDGTVSKVTFNFGDGQVVDVTDPASGVGTASVSAQTAYTYNTAGTFTASAVLTDNANGISASTSCTQTVTVTGNGVTTAPPVEPPVSLPPTGTTEVVLGIGALLLTIIVGGGFLFFFL
ncbi:MAG TPA: PKD domain-containing protein [Xanthomonadales bacterium]|nr:PKD domain-containing protein [Xanthomonadales bacterium]